jgi:hypothetical protein
MPTPVPPYEMQEIRTGEVTVLVHTGKKVTKLIPSDSVIRIKVTMRAQTGMRQETAEESLCAKERVPVQSQSLQDLLAAHHKTEAAHLFTEIHVFLSWWLPQYISGDNWQGRGRDIEGPDISTSSNNGQCCTSSSITTKG